jgi:glycosyltransferase involved in cell wall biosynthesis
VSTLAGRKLVHVTTVDMSLALLLGPQLRAFSEAGMDVVGVSAPGPYVPLLESWGIRHEPLRHATRSAAVTQDFMALIELWSLFRRLRPDIVHTHNPKPGLYGRVAARAAGVPGIVNTVHGLYASPEDRASRRGVVYALERTASMCSGAELIQNPEDLQVLAHLGVPRNKLVLLGNGIDLLRFRPPADDEARRRARTDLGVPDGAVVVGMVARLVWQKGFHDLFAAAERLRRTHPDVVFVVVGGTDADKADAIPPDSLAEAARRAHILFAGSRDNMENVYPGFDVFVLPSHREGFPRSAMEAAACGLPVIATDIRGCREVVVHGQSGLLTPLRDPLLLASAIEKLVLDPALRRQMGASGRRKAEAEFDYRIVVSKTLDAYERVLNRPTSSNRHLAATPFGRNGRAVPRSASRHLVPSRQVSSGRET